jgi:hypothetical protein
MEPIASRPWFRSAKALFLALEMWEFTPQKDAMFF